MISELYKREHPQSDDVITNRTFQVGADEDGKIPRVYRFVRPDIIDLDEKTFAEIKPLSLSGISKGATQIGIYAHIGAILRYSPSQWDPVAHTVRICGENSFVKNIAGILFYSNDETIRTFVAQATTLALLAKANKNSKTPTRGFSRTGNAISLLNRAGAFSASHVRNGIRAALSSTLSFGFRF